MRCRLSGPLAFDYVDEAGRRGRPGSSSQSPPAKTLLHFEDLSPSDQDQYLRLFRALRCGKTSLCKRISYEPRLSRTVPAPAPSPTEEHLEQTVQAAPVARGDIDPTHSELGYHHLHHHQDLSGDIVSWLDSSVVVTQLPGAPTEATLGGVVERRVEHYTVGLALGPVPVQTQEKLCRSWIERRLETELDANLSLEEVLRSGSLLCQLVDYLPCRPTQTFAPPLAARNKIDAFLKAVKHRGLDDEDLFDPADLIDYRNVPRVLRTIAAFARLVDPDGFSAVAAELPESRVNWTQSDEPDEVWYGDHGIQKLVNTAKTKVSKNKLEIVFTGSQGSGKSSTIETLMGRSFAPRSHPLRLVLDEEYLAEEAQVELQNARQLKKAAWPACAAEYDIPVPSDTTTRQYVKVSGVSVHVTELPSMESYAVRAHHDGELWVGNTGEVDKVCRELRHDEIDLVVVVERLDENGSDKLLDSLRKIRKLFGNPVWRRTLLVLTHGYCLPPDGLTYEQFTTSRRAEVDLCVRRVSGVHYVPLPVVVAENSRSCPRESSSGLRVLPDGNLFHGQLVDALEQILLGLPDEEPLLSVKFRRRWSKYFVVCVGLALLSRM